MYPTIKQLLDSVGAGKLTVEAGERYLEQRVFRGEQSVEGSMAWKHVEFGEIVFLAGIGLEKIPEDLIEIASQLVRKEATLVLCLGEWIPRTPATLISFCEAHEMVLLSVPTETRKQPLIRKLYELLFLEEDRHQSAETMMRNLVTGMYSNEDAQNAYRMGFTAGQYFVAVIWIIDDFFSIREKMGAAAFREMQERIRQKLETMLDRQKRGAGFSLVEPNDIVMLIKNDGEFLERAYFRKIHAQLKEFLEEKQMGVTVSMGVGTPMTQLSEIRRSVTEAERSLQILRSCERRDTIRCYDDIGIYRLLFELQDQEAFQNIMNGIIGRLREYDLENNEDLVETLRIYLENDRNIGASAQEMYVHRNTLKYRLNKIEEILLCDLADVNTCFNLRLAFKIDRFLQSEKNAGR